jgi:hypothetical protein
MALLLSVVPPMCCCTVSQLPSAAMVLSPVTLPLLLCMNFSDPSGNSWVQDPYPGIHEEIMASLKLLHVTSSKFQMLESEYGHIGRMFVGFSNNHGHQRCYMITDDSYVVSAFL